jgi:hypothetical protein
MRKGGALLPVLFAVLLCGRLPVLECATPERRVEANVITSQRDPAMRIQLPRGVRYAGADRWILFGIADCELHVFVEADARKVVQRLYWVQFEGYIPERPELAHTYPMTQTETLAGMIFDVRARFGPGNDTPKPGSDLEHVQALVRGKGYKVPEGMMNVRFVHLLDSQKRKELMIIYAEDLSSKGLTFQKLMPGGEAAGQWPVLEKGLIERAKKAITLEP